MLLDKLVKAAKYRKPAGVAAVLDIPRHSLPWPAEGKVLSGFGREKDKDLGTWIVRQGLTLATPAAAPVAAVASGRVIFSGPFRSYGQVMILDHGGGFFSVYGGLGEILKGEERRRAVRTSRSPARGEGKEGAAGRVYLEIRRGTEALDPLAWLEKKIREKHIYMRTQRIFLARDRRFAFGRAASERQPQDRRGQHLREQMKLLVDVLGYIQDNYVEERRFPEIGLRRGRRHGAHS